MASKLEENLATRLLALGRREMSALAVIEETKADIDSAIREACGPLVEAVLAQQAGFSAGYANPGEQKIRWAEIVRLARELKGK